MNSNTSSKKINSNISTANIIQEKRATKHVNYSEKVKYYTRTYIGTDGQERITFRFPYKF